MKTMSELCNIQELQTLNEDLQAQNNELQSQYGFYLYIFCIKRNILSYFFYLLDY